MRILLIHNFYQYWGGEDAYIKSLSKLLTDHGHSVYMYSKSSSDIKLFQDKFRTAKGLYNNRTVYKELSQIVKKFKPDLAHSQNLIPLITKTAHEVCRDNNIPIVHTIQTYRYMCPKGTLFRNGKICRLCIGKRLQYPAIVHKCYHGSMLASANLAFSSFMYSPKDQLRLIDKIHYPSTFIKKFYENTLLIPSKKGFVAPNFIFNKNTTPSLNSASYYIFVGRLAEEKGVVELVRYFSTLPNKKLVMVGDGPLKNYVMQNKTKNITYLGFLNRNSILKLMSGAIATIVPSPWYEVCPTVVMESYAVGTPVIAPNFGVFPELISHKETGYLYDKESTQGFSSALQDSKIYLKMKNKCRREFEIKYSDSVHYSLLMKEYSRLVRNKK